MSQLKSPKHTHAAKSINSVGLRVVAGKQNTCEDLNKRLAKIYAVARQRAIEAEQDK